MNTKVLQMAQQFREVDPRLTDEQAFDKAWRTATPDDRQEYRAAEQAHVTTRTETLDPWAGRSAEKMAHDQIMIKANEERTRDSTLTEEQAFDRVWSTNPHLRELYRKGQAIDQHPKPPPPPKPVVVAPVNRTAKLSETKTPFSGRETKRCERGVVIEMNDARGIRRKVFVGDSLAKHFDDAA